MQTYYLLKRYGLEHEIDLKGNCYEKQNMARDTI